MLKPKLHLVKPDERSFTAGEYSLHLSPLFSDHVSLKLYKKTLITEKSIISVIKKYKYSYLLCNNIKMPFFWNESLKMSQLHHVK